jgi:hypothetical protein
VVVDIDDLLVHDERARILRESAVRGEISWDRVTQYTHRNVRRELTRLQPDVLLNHSPFGTTMPWLGGDFAVEEWFLTPPPIDDIVSRVRDRAKPEDKDYHELIARVNYSSLRRSRPSKRAVKVDGGSWTELWNRLLKEYIDTIAVKHEVSERVLDVCEGLGGCYAKRARRVKMRSIELGKLGTMLRGYLVHTDLIDKRSIESDVLYMGRTRESRSELAVCAYSLLCMDFPVQTKVSLNTMWTLADSALSPLPVGGRPRVDILNKEDRRKNYPLKNHPGASNKVNVYANEVYSRARELIPHLCEQVNDCTVYHDGFTDDQLSALIMFSVATNPYVSDSPRLGTRMIRDPRGAKSLSNVVKSLGLNATQFGAAVCESESLLGRGVGTPDKMGDAKYRVGGEELESKLHRLDPLKMRRAVREVISRECPNDIEFEDVDAFWHRRWEWCVNGAHSKLIERLHPGLVDPEPGLTHRQVHRKVFAERLVWETVTGWDGESYFTLSLKLECGKTRFIYSGDSLTYFAFEHLLKPVETRWKNIRAILDPGGIGTWKIGKRIRAMRRWGPVNVMLDYDDFNSHHTIEWMQMVIEELCDHTGYPPALMDKLVYSLAHQHLNVDGEEIGLLAGTLMSGHRGTTFFNTILNEAYIRVAYPEIDSLKSMHVGDDVYISAQSYDQAQRILSACEEAGLAMNPLKQSVGIYAAEFLRVCYGEVCARGYVCRSIATCVNGNWSSDVRLNAEEGLKSIIGHSWTLCNRAGNFDMGALLVSSVKRMCRLSSSVARELLTGSAGLADGPSRANGLTTRSYHLDIDTDKETEELALATQGMGQNATIDFLTHCSTPLEQYVLGELGTSVVNTMRCASYKKTMISGGNSDEPIAPAYVRVRKSVKSVRTTVEVEEAGRGNKKGGVLSPYPLLQLVKQRVTGELLAQALMMVGVMPTYSDSDFDVAWGRRSRSLSVMGALTYGDACSLCKKCDEDLVYVNYPCYA